MRIARFSHQESIKYGIVDETELVVLKGDPLFAGFETTGERVSLADVALLAPVIPRSLTVSDRPDASSPHGVIVTGSLPLSPTWPSSVMRMKPSTRSRHSCREQTGE